ncbi:forkhead box protein A2-B isoform X2 [Anopheles stephensi]|uniref:forkhead box protein A2-B isoform X2 n=1 Tax=Anopheles stephensi TaxID=30069 RepID=UPI001658B7F1|nr:forkhead box protein A2-B isoform X2 [Anopheles stephensi]
MTQLEEDDLLNNLLKIPGTIIIYNNDMSSYDYILNAHNVALPLTPATSTAGSATSEQSVDDLNSSTSIDADMTASPGHNYTSGISSIALDTPGNSELDQSFSSVETSGPGISESSDDPNAPGLCCTGEPETDELEYEEMDTGPAEARDEDDEDDSEPELTNLSWLTELKNITNLTPSDAPLTDLPTARFNKFIAQVRRSRETYDKRKEQYTSLASSLEKPPFNYAQIIAMAMLEEGRMTLKQICKWIQEKFSYYKVHKNWNNSIRHNLSLSFFFTKVQRAKDEKGKGGYWELSMDVSKSERRRVRVRQRNKSTNNGGSQQANRRSTSARFESKATTYSTVEPAGSITNNNNNEQTVNNNLPKQPAAASCEVTPVAIEPTSLLSPTIDSQGAHREEQLIALDSNNNNCPAPQAATVTAPLQVQNVLIDIIDNYSKSALDNVLQPLPEQTEHSTLQPAVVQLPVSEAQLMQASAMVESCTINFDSIINGEHDGASIFNNLNVDEPANDDIIVPFFSNVQQVQAGPNVVVETIPYYLPDMGHFDESDFGNLININEQEISDEFLNEHGFL